MHGRSEGAHKAWAVSMLQKPLLGPEPLHEEFFAFRKGLKLGCRNGFDATEVCSDAKVVIRSPDLNCEQLFKSYEGGTELLLSILWTSCIKSFNDFKEHLDYPATSRSLLDRAFAIPYIGIAETLGELIDDFLQGTGIPCPNLFSEAVSNQLFDARLVDLSQVDKPFFRSRLFCWAATGTPLIADDARISVCTISSDGFCY